MAYFGQSLSIIVCLLRDLVFAEFFAKIIAASSAYNIYEIILIDLLISFYNEMIKNDTK